MSENLPVEVTDIQSLGTITFADDVVAIIAGLAATEIPGVAGMSGDLVGGITEVLGRKNLKKGVRVEVGNREAAVDLYVILNYGARIPDVTRQMQENVKKAIENMTGLDVIEVNVHVMGVQFEKEPSAPKQIKEPEPPRVR